MVKPAWGLRGLSLIGLIMTMVALVAAVAEAMVAFGLR